MDYFGQSTYKEKWNGLDLVYSCDKIVFTGRFAFGGIEPMLGWLAQLRTFGVLAPPDQPWGYFLKEVRFYEKFAVMSYRNNFVFEFFNEAKEKVSFYLGVGFNTAMGFVETWRVEFNPNKVLLNCGAWARDFLLRLKGCSKVGGLTNSIEVKSFDLAIDFPVARDCVLYEKGQRVHKLFMYSALNRTDYYGDSRKHGATKIYNKALEAGLERDLTRLEVTLELDDFDSVRHYFEGLRVLRHGQIVMEELGTSLKQNDRVFLELLNLHPEYLSRLTYRKRDAFKPYLKDFVQPFVLSLKAFHYVAGWTAAFITLDIRSIFGDDR
ncbi:MAG: hypothetical protein FWC27_10085 [Firmicutes bacterium]|nr:hypothetical protein [Bacillota bacterium]